MPEPALSLPVPATSAVVAQIVPVRPVPVPPGPDCADVYAEGRDLFISTALWYIRTWREHPMLMALGHGVVLGGGYLVVRYIRYRLPVMGPGFMGNLARRSGSLRSVADDAQAIYGTVRSLRRSRAPQNVDYTQDVRFQPNAYRGQYGD